MPAFFFVRFSCKKNIKRIIINQIWNEAVRKTVDYVYFLCLHRANWLISYMDFIKERIQYAYIHKRNHSYRHKLNSTSMYFQSKNNGILVNENYIVYTQNKSKWNQLYRFIYTINICRYRMHGSTNWINISHFMFIYYTQHNTDIPYRIFCSILLFLCWYIWNIKKIKWI